MSEMKVMLLNGSPKENGSTYRALCEAAKVLNDRGIETEIMHVGKGAVSGCMGCGYCRSHGKCVLNDNVNIFGEKMAEADGIIVGSPVHYASASGAVTSFLDRLFYSGKGKLEYKPAAAIAVCRRGGASATFDQLNKYFTISNMPVVSSQYWNMAYGNNPDEISQDAEGLQTIRHLAANMAWLLKCIELGKDKGIVPEFDENRVSTNFIR